MSQSGLKGAAPAPAPTPTYSSGYQEWSHLCHCCSELGPQPQEPGVLKAGETCFQAIKTNKWNHLSQFQACLSILQMAHVALLISQGMFLFFFILFCWFSLKPKAEDLSAFEPQSRLFPGTLYVVMVLPSVILTHAWACLSLSPGHALPSRGQLAPGYWPKHALSLRAGIHSMGPD